MWVLKGFIYACLCVSVFRAESQGRSAWRPLAPEVSGGASEGLCLGTPCTGFPAQPSLLLQLLPSNTPAWPAAGPPSAGPTPAEAAVSCRVWGGRLCTTASEGIRICSFKPVLGQNLELELKSRTEGVWTCLIVAPPS